MNNDLNPRWTSRQRLGHLAENHVSELLKAKGFQIIGRNQRVGRYEIDIVAHRNGLWVFCEVRSRRTGVFGTPALTIDKNKQRRLRIAAIGWMKKKGARGKVRMDAAGVIVKADGFHVDYFAGSY